MLVTAASESVSDDGVWGQQQPTIANDHLLLVSDTALKDRPSEPLSSFSLYPLALANTAAVANISKQAIKWLQKSHTNTNNQSLNILIKVG